MSLLLRFILDVKNAVMGDVCSRERSTERWLQADNFQLPRLSQRYCLHSEV